MMNKIRVADYIALRAVEAGAKHVFLVTGGGAMHLNDAFGRHPDLTPVCFHHEQAAAMAAESYYRVTNRLALLNVTTGPGGINALNGVYGAYTDSLGMLIVSGQVKRETYLRNYSIPLRQLGDQEIDIVSMVKPIVKYSTVLQDPLEVGVVMDKAIYLATHGRPGPAWIDVPVDVQSVLIDPASLPRFKGDINELSKDKDITENTRYELVQKTTPLNEKLIEELVSQLKKSIRPAIFVGAGIRISGMYQAFLNLANQLKIPVVSGWNAHDTLANDNLYYTGRPGTVGDRAGNFTVQNADFLLILGSRLNIRQVSYNWKSFAHKAWKVMVDIDKAELEKPTLQIDLKIHADLKEFIPLLAKALRNYKSPVEHQNYLAWCKERVVNYPTVLPHYYNTKDKINPYVFIHELFKVLSHDDVIVTGNGSACVVTFQAAQLKEGQRLFTNSGSASMGYDLPAAIGASLALNKKRIICLAGDGSLMMNLQELETMQGYKLPIKVFVLNNYGYASIRQTQEAYFSDNLFGIGPEDGVTLPDFIALGKAFKIPSIKVNSIEEWLSASVQELLDSKDSALIEVMLDPKQTFSPKLASKKMPDGTMVSPALEDMAPFLSKEELARNIL
jgi:acetolactate synthase-1/2/3 large subunit